MRKLFLVCTWMMAAMAMAIPAKRIKKTITLEDGTVKEVVLRGDEHVHFYQDAEGNAYQRIQGDVFRQVDKLQAVSTWKERLTQRNSQRTRRMAMRKATWGASSNPISGSKKGLVILVNFKDKSLTSKHTQSYYNNFFNQVGFSQDGMAGSVHDYFKESSYGQFDLTFDVVGPVTVSQNMSYYGANDSQGSDKHPGSMVIEAVKLADKLDVDFSKYDWDGDGYVDQVFCVYAGYGEHATDVADQIWPHEFELSACKSSGDGTGPVSVDGVTVDTYAVTCELRGSSGTTADGIGTACHEFSHCMCIPDMYDTDYSGAITTGTWDLMDYGSSCGEDWCGECPAGYTSYERMYCGWLTPTELSSPCQISGMKSLAKNPEAYIIYNQKNRNEYYMLENRQQEGFDKHSFGHGMLILHVDYNKTAWEQNAPNDDPSHPRMTIIAADNDAENVSTDGYLSETCIAGDPWPGTSKNTALTDTSKPAATLYNANSDGRKYMGKPITSIAESNGLISFTFDGGSTPLAVLDAPVAIAASQITANSFVANWKKVADATSYEVELTATDIDNGGNNGGDNTGGDNTGGDNTGGDNTGGDNTGGDNTGSNTDLSKVAILIEDFSGFKKGTSDGTSDLGESMDSYTKVKGWEGSKIYTTPNAEIKMGSSKSAGYLYSPWLESKKGVVTVVVAARSYNNDSKTMYFIYGEDMQGDEVGKFTIASETGYYVIEIQDVGDEFWVGLESSARAYISEFYVLDGSFTDAQLEKMFKAPHRVSQLRSVASSANTSARAVQRNVAPRKASKTTTYTTTATSYTFTGLTADKTYSYRVRAVNANGKSAWSNTIQVQLATAIESIEAGQPSTSSTVMYDLQGRQVGDTNRRGIYIKNGKKILK